MGTGTGTGTGRGKSKGKGKWSIYQAAQLIVLFSGAPLHNP